MCEIWKGLRVVKFWVHMNFYLFFCLYFVGVVCVLNYGFLMCGRPGSMVVDWDPCWISWVLFL